MGAQTSVWWLFQFLSLVRRQWENMDGIDFLRGDEPYKQRAGAQPTRVLRMRAFAPTLMPQLLHAAWWAGFEVKQWMRKRTGRTPVVVVEMPADQSACMSSQ